jgi:hypothetical protein
MRPLTTDLDLPDARPYFLWDEERTVAEFRAALEAASGAERTRLIGKLMREARDTGVWRFVGRREVADTYEAIRPHLGRRRPFWGYLLDGWRRDGIIESRPALGAPASC